MTITVFIRVEVARKDRAAKNLINIFCIFNAVHLAMLDAELGTSLREAESRLGSTLVGQVLLCRGVVERHVHVVDPLRFVRVGGLLK